MKHMQRVAFYFSLLLMITLFGCEHLEIRASEAAQHSGKFATVTGKVSSVKTINIGKPNELHFLNFGRPHPQQDFTVVIKGRHKNRFRPVRDYKNQMVKVTGRIGMYKGKPQIRLKAANRLKILK
jgi:DNA/RNA endonuclease YhcR with UshA esterase domain